MRIKHQLAQEARKEIDRAWTGLDNKSGNIVTKMEAAHNLKSDLGSISPDASQLSNIPSSDIDRTNSDLNSKIDNLATENQLCVFPSQAGKSDLRSASSAIISQDSHSTGRKIHPRADAGQNQEVIAGTMVTLDGTSSKIGDNSGTLSYSWKQAGGPKVRIIDVNTAIASFEAPKISSAEDKLTLKFVLSIADSLGRNNDKDTVTVVVKHDPSVSPIVDSPSSTNSNDYKDRTASHAERNGHSNNNQVVDNGDNSKSNVNGKSEETKNEEIYPQPDSNPPTESEHSDTNNNDTGSN